MKNRQHNGLKKRDKRTNNDLQNTTQKTNEEQTTQWPKEKGQKDKQRFTKHYIENYRWNNTTPTKN